MHNIVTPPVSDGRHLIIKIDCRIPLKKRIIRDFQQSSYSVATTGGGSSGISDIISSSSNNNNTTTTTLHDRHSIQVPVVQNDEIMSLQQHNVKSNTNNTKTSTPATVANTITDETPIKEVTQQKQRQQSNTNTVWFIGQVVEVASRTWPGINRPGGCGRIIKINRSDEDDDEIISLDVRYMLYSGTDTGIDLEYVKPLNPEITTTRVRRTIEVYSDDVENKKKASRRQAAAVTPKKEVVTEKRKQLEGPKPNEVDKSDKIADGVLTNSDSNDKKVSDISKVKMDRILKAKSENERPVEKLKAKKTSSHVVEIDRKENYVTKKKMSKFQDIKDDAECYKRKTKKLKKVNDNNENPKRSTAANEPVSKEHSNEYTIPKKKNIEKIAANRKKDTKIIEKIPKEISFNSIRIDGMYTGSEAWSPLTEPKSDRSSILGGLPGSTSDDITPTDSPIRFLSNISGHDKAKRKDVNEMKMKATTKKDNHHQLIPSAVLVQHQSHSDDIEQQQQRKEQRKREKRLQTFKDLLSDIMEGNMIVEDSILSTFENDPNITIRFTQSEINEYVSMLVNENKLFQSDGVLYRL